MGLPVHRLYVCARTCGDCNLGKDCTDIAHGKYSRARVKVKMFMLRERKIKNMGTNKLKNNMAQLRAKQTAQVHCG